MARPIWRDCAAVAREALRDVNHLSHANAIRRANLRMNRSCLRVATTQYGMLVENRQIRGPYTVYGWIRSGGEPTRFAYKLDYDGGLLYCSTL